MPFVRNLGKTNCLTHIPEDIKLELDPLNVTVVGSPTISKGVVSGFSSTSWLKTPNVFSPGTNTWEVLIKFTTGTVGTQQYIFNSNCSYQAIQISIETNKTLNAYGYINNTSTELFGKIATGYTLSANTTYYAELKYTGGGYTLTLFDGNKNKLDLVNNSVSTAITGGYSSVFGVDLDGVDVYRVGAFTGSIDLSNSYIKINDEIWWKGGTGNLTLKAGSKVYVPNGFEEDGVTPKFDEVVIESDVVDNFSPNTTGSCLLVYEPAINNVTFAAATGDNAYYFSGKTAPSNPKNFYIWYDTANNRVKQYNGSAWIGGFSLPHASISYQKTGVVTGINQVFNGFGYIGSTVFALPGVKGLIPDGWNDNGTLRNIERTNNSLLVVDTSGYIAENHTWEFFINFQKEYRNSYKHFEQATQPTNIQSTTATWFNTSENRIYITNDSGATWSKANLCQAFKYTQLADGRITSFTPKPVGGKNKTRLYQLAKKKRHYYKYDYRDYTLKNMTGYSAPEGSISQNISDDYYTSARYQLFWNREMSFNTKYPTGTVYVIYQFPNPLKTDTYNITMYGHTQSNNNVTARIYVQYTDGEELLLQEKLIQYGSTTSWNFNFTASKPIKRIGFHGVANPWNSANTVCTLGGFNIKSTTGNLQTYHGVYEVDKPEDADYYIEGFEAYSPILKTGKHYVKLFESSTGGTYNVTVPKDSKARIAIVGGGGAAAIRGVYDDRGYGWGGGSGGAFIGTFALPKGTYSVTVGSANNNTKGQGGNTATLNPTDLTTHDSYITGVVRVGGGGSGHYNSNYVGAAGASATFEIEPLSVTMNKAGNAGTYNSGGKGSSIPPKTCAGGNSVYNGHGKGQGCVVSEYANSRRWIDGTNGYVKIEVYSETENQLY